MVRISIPTIKPHPHPLPPSALTLLPVKEAAQHLSEFLAAGKGETLVLSGAGVSVDSGIRAYRGKEGQYSNPNYTPILYHELVEDTPRGALFRKRYWARSFLGYPPVREAQPNPTHIYIAALSALGLAPNLITQNVDNLHPKAASLITSRLAPNVSLPKSKILELHGTLARVHCLAHRHEQHRDEYQEQLGKLNPIWQEMSDEFERTGDRPRTNPDGDVELEGVDFNSFQVPPCRQCEAERREKLGIVKPNVVFFGETLLPSNRDLSLDLVNQSSRLLVLGTSLATYSAFRLVKQAREQGKEVLMISLGPSRADPLPGLQKMERKAGDVLRVFLDETLKTNSGPEVEAVKAALDLGVVKAPPNAQDSIAGPSRHAGRVLGAGSRPFSTYSRSAGVARVSPLQALGRMPARRYQSSSTPIVIDTIATTTETSLLDPLVHVLLSSPLPAWATIIGLTLCVRTGITLPVTLWQRGRMLTEAREVRPRMREINEKLAVALAKECRSKGVGYEEYKKQLKARLAIEQSALHKRFKTHPTITMIAPLAVHVPILITLSLTLRRALELPGSNMATEGFLWLTTLDVPDPIGVLPLLGAVIALSNAETLGRKREQAMEAVAAKTTASSKTPQVRLKQTRPPKPLVAEEPASPARYESPPTVRVTGQSRRLSTASVMAAAHRPIIKTSSRSTSKRTLDEIPAADAPKSGLTDSDRSNLRSLLLTYVLRGMAVLFIPFASIAPAGLAMYWVTSLSYTLGQTLVLNRMDRKAVEARKLAGASP